MRGRVGAASDYGPAALAMPSQAVSVQRGHFQISTLQAPVGRGKKDQPVLILPAGRLLLRKQEGVPRNWGSGGNDCEHRRRQGAHRKRPPAILWLLSDRSESNIRLSPAPQGGILLVEPSISSVIEYWLHKYSFYIRIVSKIPGRTVS